MLCRQPRRTGRPSREDAVLLSDHVLAAAARLFAERGYAATSIAAVASEARVGKHTIYRRFPDKAELFRAVVQQKGQQLLGLDEAMAPPPGCSLVALHGFAMRIAHALATPDALWIFRLIVGEGDRFPELRGIMMKCDGDPVLERCIWLIGRAQEGGKLAPGDPQMLAEVLLDLVATSILHRRLASDELDDEEQALRFVERGWDFFLRGARVPAAA
jgi:AcrR family transcriptional regulator